MMPIMLKIMKESENLAMTLDGKWLEMYGALNKNEKNSVFCCCCNVYEIYIRDLQRARSPTLS